MRGPDGVSPLPTVGSLCLFSPQVAHTRLHVIVVATDALRLEWRGQQQGFTPGRRPRCLVYLDPTLGSALLAPLLQDVTATKGNSFEDYFLKRCVPPGLIMMAVVLPSWPLPQRCTTTASRQCFVYGLQPLLLCMRSSHNA